MRKLGLIDSPTGKGGKDYRLFRETIRRLARVMYENSAFYDPMRGEPRGPRARGLASVLKRARGLLDVRAAYDYVFRSSRHPTAADARIQTRGTITFDTGLDAPALPKFAAEELGDCISCTLCVQVCPTGIDIRNGLQYECIACGACIDACDSVMDKMGYPRGLIRYSSQNAIDAQPARVLRPRMLIYGALLVTLVAAWVIGVSTRSPLIADVLRDRNALYRVNSEGIGNGYTLKLINKTDLNQHYRITLESATPGIALRTSAQTIEVGPEQVLAVPIEVGAPAGISGRHELTFVIESLDGKVRRSISSSFFGPPQ